MTQHRPGLHRPPRRLGLLAAALVLAAAPAAAQTFQEPVLETLYLADNPLELQRVATQRLASQPQDVQALLALALALSTLERGDAPARQVVIGRAEACMQQLPQAAPCHYAFGVVMGMHAMSEGHFKALRSAGAVRAALEQALTLEPAWYPARSAVVEFHALAPALLGGSTAKALAVARAAPTSEQARVLEARVALGERQFEVALDALTGLLSAPDTAVARDALEWGAQAGLGLINAGQAAKAQAFFTRVLREQPGQAIGGYGLARVRGELGAPAEALALYQRAAALAGAARWPMDYRIGMMQQQLGRLDDAKASYTRFLATGSGQKSAQSDAKKRLGQLGG